MARTEPKEPLEVLGQESWERFLRDVADFTTREELEILVNKHIHVDEEREFLLCVKDAVFLLDLDPEDAQLFLRYFYQELLRTKSRGYDEMDHRVHLGIDRVADGREIRIPIDEVLKEAGYGQKERGG